MIKGMQRAKHTVDLLKMVFLEERRVGDGTCEDARVLNGRKSRNRGGTRHLRRWTPLRPDRARTVRRSSSLKSGCLFGRVHHFCGG